MDFVRRYMLSLICASMLCGILNDLTQKTFFHKQMQFVCGILILVTILQPFYRFTIPEFSTLDTLFHAEAESAINRGRDMHNNAFTKVIKQEMEAYILKEAAAAGADVSVFIEILSSVPTIQARAEITGAVNEVQKGILEAAMSRLEITKENQKWISQEYNDSNSLFPEN